MIGFLTEDLYLYYDLASKFFQGQIPYKDYFFDYFPGAFLFFVLPRFLTASVFYYLVIFLSLTTTLFFLQLLFLIKKWEKTQREKIWLIFLILSGVLIFPLSLIRFDLVPTLLTLLAVNSFLTNKTLKSDVFLALGTVTKIFPAVLMPLFLVHLWRKKMKMRIFKVIFVYFLTCAVFISPFIFLGGGQGLMQVVNYHLNRTIQIESLPASVLLFSTYLGNTVNTFNAFSSWNVGSPNWDLRVSQFFFVLWLFSFVLIYFWFYRQTKKLKGFGQQDFLILKGVLMVILVFIGFNKVFSPQYLIWLWPFVLWYMLYLPSEKIITLGTIWSLIFFLTIWNLSKYTELINLDRLAILGQILRNVLYLTFLGVVLLTKAEKIKPASYQKKL